MEPWHEQDDFWETFAPILFGDEKWEAAPEQVDQILALTRLPPGAHVLDLACGPGRHSLELARRGFRVTGVDRTPVYLDAARAKAEEEGLDAEWVEADMRAFQRPAAFDAVVNLFTAFGYFEDPEDDRRVAASMVEALRPGGVLVMDLMGKEIVARRFVPRDWSELPDGSFMLEERTISPGWDWTDNRWVLIRDGRVREFHVSHRLYSAVELRDLLTGCGCATVEVFGGLDGRPYDHEATRLTLVGRRA